MENQQPLAEQIDIVFTELFHKLRIATACEDGLTGTQFFTLRYIVANQKVTISDLASTINVTLSAITGLVNRLVKLELVRRQKSEGDRRNVWVFPTEKGIALIKAANLRRQELITHYLQNISPEALFGLKQFCQHLTKSLQINSTLE
ncbi:MarR family transcriptional regulator [Bacillota bacterium LX-D]|nr:MarR family transcriptional regulator [Bacillota bacterium LX-D]